MSAKTIGVRVGVALVAVIGGLYLFGAFGHGRIEPGVAPAPPTLPPPARTAKAERVTGPLLEESVGTVRSVREVTVAAQVTARVVAVRARVGDRVTAGSPHFAVASADDSVTFLPQRWAAFFAPDAPFATLEQRPPAAAATSAAL